MVLAATPLPGRWTNDGKNDTGTARAMTPPHG
jgi:hypothetical protein